VFVSFALECSISFVILVWSDLPVYSFFCIHVACYVRNSLIQVSHLLFGFMIMLVMLCSIVSDFIYCYYCKNFLVLSESYAFVLKSEIIFAINGSKCFAKY
jgi:hypothetical protein